MLATRRTALSLSAAALVAIPAAGAGTPLHCAIAELRAAQALIREPTPAHLTGDRDDDYNAALADLEDGAYEAIGRAPAQSLTELRVKIGLMLEAMGDRVNARDGFFGAGDAALAVLIAGTEADIARLIP